MTGIILAIDVEQGGLGIKVTWSSKTVRYLKILARVVRPDVASGQFECLIDSKCLSKKATSRCS